MRITLDEVESIRHGINLTVISATLMSMSMFMLGMTQEKTWIGAFFATTTIAGWWLMITNWDNTKDALEEVKEKVE